MLTGDAKLLMFVLTAGFLLDLILGDPLWLPHPVVAIGRLISFLEKILRRCPPASSSGDFWRGLFLTTSVCAATIGATWSVRLLAYTGGQWLGIVFDILVCYQVLATKCLRDAARLVSDSLENADLSSARAAVGRIVGRDTSALDEPAIIRATVETVSENASDGVVAPMLFFIFGGPVLAMLYKAVNTMDSMLGYKNERYLFFGRPAARLDDILNYIPARITGWLMVAAAWLCGMDWQNSIRTFRRDRRKHTSPNAGQPEAACAGALRVQLGGNSRYGGVVVEKPVIGDDIQPVEINDIRRAICLLYGTALHCYVVGELLLWFW